MLAHQLFALLVGQGVPVVFVTSTFRHRVKTEGPHPFGRKNRKEPIVDHLFGHTARVLAHLGHRHVTLGDLEAGALNLGLKFTQVPEILAENHKTSVGLRPHDRRGDDLEPGHDRVIHRLAYRTRVNFSLGVAKEVNHVESA